MGSTGRSSKGRSRTRKRRIFSGRRSATSGVGRLQSGKDSGAGTCGIVAWWSSPGSAAWNDDEKVKIGSPFWMAMTRRDENE